MSQPNKSTSYIYMYTHICIYKSTFSCVSIIHIHVSIIHVCIYLCIIHLLHSPSTLVHGDKCSRPTWPLTVTSDLKAMHCYLGERLEGRALYTLSCLEPIVASHGPQGGAQLIPRPRSSDDPPLSLLVLLLSLMVL